MMRRIAARSRGCVSAIVVAFNRSRMSQAARAGSHVAQ
jgi:hypothetical protein